MIDKIRLRELIAGIDRPEFTEDFEEGEGRWVTVNGHHILIGGEESKSTTDSWEKLARPAKSAAHLVAETSYPEITEGTEKQIQYAKDLRDAWVSNVSNRESSANVRWAVVKQERGESLGDTDISHLATDAWNRRLVGKLNTSNAKVVIDLLASSNTKGQAAKLDAISRYQNIIRFPKKWSFDGKAWKRIDYK